MLRQTVLPLAIAVSLGAAPVAALAQDSAAVFVPKSPGTAVALSLLGTVAPTALGVALMGGDGSGGGGLLFSYGIFLGPSTGYFYAGRSGRAFGGAGIRLGFTGLTVMAISAACGGDIVWGCEDESAANVVAFLGLGLITMSAIYDIVGSGHAADEWNVRHQPPRVTLAPRIDPIARSGGAAIRVTF